MRDQLRANLGDAGNLLESRAGLVSGSVVFLAPGEAAAMDQTVRLVTYALSSDPYQQQIALHAPELARRPQTTAGGVAIDQLGRRIVIADAASLSLQDGAVSSADERIDLIYHRVTDFYLADERNAMLRSAYELDLAVITLHPAAHARWADKRLLAWLGDEEMLQEAGLGADDRLPLRQTIPATEAVEPAAADDLWKRRKNFFLSFGESHPRTALQPISVSTSATASCMAKPGCGQRACTEGRPRISGPPGVASRRC